MAFIFEFLILAALKCEVGYRSLVEPMETMEQWKVTTMGKFSFSYAFYIV